MTDGAPNSYSSQMEYVKLFKQANADAKRDNNVATRSYAFALGDDADVPFMAALSQVGSEGGSLYFVQANSSSAISNLTTSFQNTVTVATTQAQLPRVIVKNKDNNEIQTQYGRVASQTDYLVTIEAGMLLESRMFTDPSTGLVYSVLNFKTGVILNNVEIYTNEL